MKTPWHSGRMQMLAIVAAVLLLLAGCGGTSSKTQTTPHGSDAALEALKDGNARYVTGNVSEIDTSVMQRATLSEGQEPFAVIVGCADSRVPPELLFDQDLGDIWTSPLRW